MTDDFKPIAVTFLMSMAPHEAGDVAGFPHAKAHELVQRRVADFYPPTQDAVVSVAGPIEPDLLDTMDRAGLVAFAKKHLGLHDEPPIDVTDAALRDAIRANVDPVCLHDAADEVTVEDQTEAGGKPAKGGKKG